MALAKLFSCPLRVENLGSRVQKGIQAVLLHSEMPAADEVGAGAGERLPALPEAPTNCCMSGCPNCVWLEYADQVASVFKNRSEEVDLEEVLREIDEQIKDPMIKSFIKMEINCKYRTDAKSKPSTV